MTSTVVNNGDTYATVRAKINQADAIRRYISYGVIDLGVNTPPATPNEGDVYIVGTSPIGAWASQSDKLAIWYNSTWIFEPSVDSSGGTVGIGATHEGLTVYVRGYDLQYVWDGTAWIVAQISPEVIRDTIGATLVAGANVTITPNDGADTITIESANTTDPEVVRDTIGATLVAGANVTITPNDGADTITIEATSSGGSLSLATLAALRAATWPGGRPTDVSVITNVSAGDLGGWFRWEAASTAADNGGTIIKETAVATGRWFRQDPGITPHMWGAHPSASAAVNRDAIQAAQDYAKTVGGAVSKFEISGTYQVARRVTGDTDCGLIMRTAAELQGLGTGAPSDPNVAKVTLVPSENMPIFIKDEYTKARVVTATVGTPGTFNLTAHGFSAGQAVYFSSDGTSPGGTFRLFPYYVITDGLTADAFRISSVPGGAAIAISSTGTGTNYCISASTLTHSNSIKNINIYGGPANPVVMVMVALSSNEGTFEDIVVNPSLAANQRSGWLHLENPVASWLCNFHRVKIGGFTSGVGKTFFGSDSNITDCTFSGCNTNFRFNQGSVTVHGGQCENANNGSGIGTGTGIDVHPSGTGRNVASVISGMKFVSNGRDVNLRTAANPTTMRTRFDILSHDCRGPSVYVGANINSVHVRGDWNEPNPTTAAAVQFENATTATGCVIGESSFSQLPENRIINTPPDCEVLAHYGRNAAGAKLRTIRSTLGDKRLDVREFAPKAGQSGYTSDIVGDFQNAINEAYGAKERLFVPKGTMFVSAPLLVPGNGFHLVGEGAGNFDNDFAGNSIIRALSGHAGAMFLVGNQSVHVTGGSFEGIALDGAGYATKGFDFVDAQYFTGEDVSILDVTSIGAHWRNGGVVAANPCGHTTWRRLKIKLRTAAGVNAHGIFLDGSGSAGCSMFTFDAPQVQTRNGHGYRIKGADGFLFLRPYHFTDGPGRFISYETTAAYPIGAGTFVHAIGSAPIVLENNLTDPGTTLTFLDHPTGDGQPLPSGPGRHAANVTTADGRMYGKHALRIGSVEFNDPMSFVNYTSPLLTTNNGNWRVIQTGTGSIANHGFIGGGINMQTGAAGGNEIYLSDTNVIGSGGFSVASSPQAMWVLTPTLLVTQIVRFGFLTETAGNPKGIYFEADTSVNGNWWCVTRAFNGTADVSTRTDTGIPVAVAKRHFMIHGQDDGFYFYTRVDETVQWNKVGLHTTNIPSSSVQLSLVTGIKMSSGGAKALFVYQINHQRRVE